MRKKSIPMWLWVAGGITVAALIGAGAVYAIQQARDADAQREAQNSRDTTATAEPTPQPEEPKGTESAEQPTPPSAPEEESPVPDDSPATPLPKSQFAFVTQLTDGDPGTIVVDYAEYLTGARAAEAAKARGDESPPPNDYYVVNENTKLRSLKIAAGAKVRLVTNPDGTSDPAGYTASVEQWARYWAAPSDENAAIRAAGYWIVIEEDVVTAVREQFAP